jgi:hypothetical protein
VALAVFVCVLGTGACADAIRAAGDTLRVHEVPAATDVGRIMCETADIRIETPEVRAYPDGVHLALENPGGVWGLEFHPESWEYGQSEGHTFGDDVTNVTSAMPPGRVTVACLPTEHASYDDPEAATAIITIVDPDGLYVPPIPTCGFGDQSRITIAASEDADPTDVFRRVPGVRPSDEFRTPNYPKSPQYWPTFIVYRDGEAIARLMAPGIGEEWDLLVDTCPGIGIAGA